MTVGGVSSAAGAVYQGGAARPAAEGSAGEEASESQAEKTREAALQSQNGNSISVVA